MKQIIQKLVQKKIIVTIIILSLVILAGIYFLAEQDKKTLAIKSFSIMEKTMQFLPINKDTKKELQTLDKLSQELTKKDNQTRRYLILLQNNMELRPGGGFLGQYAVLKIKNGEIESMYIEDANILDQRIKAKIKPPYPFKRMMQIKKWKFRDSNFSPDFLENVKKAKYFYRLAGGNDNFDGVIAINSNVLNHLLELSGPIYLKYYGEFNSKNATLKLEEAVEKKYLYNENLDTRYRKAVMKKLAAEIKNRLFHINKISQLSQLGLRELREKNIMLAFQNQELQEAIKSVHWDGTVAQDWSGDYLMVVDANMGALKSDYYIKRSLDYYVDLTGEKPVAFLKILYKHTATHGDWRTSDYHSYLRVYTPQGSKLLERKMVSYPLIADEFNKTYFGFILHTLINRQTLAEIKYELPEKVRQGNYRLLIQKQSGVGDIPIKITIKTKDGEKVREEVLKNDLVLEMKMQ